MIFAEAKPEDRAAIETLLRAAFGGNEEVDIVARLERDGLVVLSLVAFEDGEIVGHVLYSVLDVTVDGRPIKALALAPMSVVPRRQRSGIGSKLIAESLRLLKMRDWHAIIVLGHEHYYPRFGFSPELARKLESPFKTDAFMALELKPGALAGTAGEVRYPPAFGL